jgi:CRP-like cAMP-binding protein
VDTAVLAEIPLFAQMSEEDRKRFAGVCVELEVDAGRTVVAEGDFGYAMFAIKDGTADVMQDGAVLCTIGPGEVFGEVAVLFGGVRTATVVAKTPLRLITVMNGEVHRLERQAPEVGAALRAKMAECLRA